MVFKIKNVIKLDTVRNNWYIILKFCRICPFRLVCDILYQVLSKAKMFIFSIFYPLYVFNALQNNSSYMTIVMYVVIAIIINLAIDIYVGLYNTYKSLSKETMMS
jgi:uncharacterized membrane protein YczE